MMSRIWWLGACVVLACVAAWGLDSARAEDEKASEASTKAVSIPTKRGVALEGVLHLPAKPTGTIVVIGSGRGYHKDLPFLKRTAEELQKVGVAALRFDWAYFTAKKQHAPDLSTELEDLEGALDFAKGVDGVKHVVLAGKSLGSVAAMMRVSTKHDDIAALMLLTWPIHGPKKPGEVSPMTQGLQKGWDKPWLIACGDADPYSELTPLYALAGACTRAPRLVIAPGDHGFNGPNGHEDKPTTLANVNLAAHGIARWARLWAEGFAAAK